MSSSARVVLKIFARISDSSQMLFQVAVAIDVGVYFVGRLLQCRCRFAAYRRVHGSRYSRGYGAALDILHLSDSSAASIVRPWPHPKTLSPIQSSCIQGRRVVVRVRAHRCRSRMSSVVSLALAFASLLIHVVECCSALHVFAGSTYGAMAAG